MRHPAHARALALLGVIALVGSGFAAASGGVLSGGQANTLGMLPGQTWQVHCPSSLKATVGATNAALVCATTTTTTTSTTVAPTTTVPPTTTTLAPTTTTAAPTTTTTAPPPVLSPDIVPQSIPNDCSVPVDAQLQAWLSSLPPGTTAQLGKIVPDVGTAVDLVPACYGVDNPVRLDGLNGITIEGNGSTLKALTQQSVAGAGQNRHILTVNNSTGVTVDRVVLWGANDGRFPAPTVDLEWQHGISFQGGSHNAFTRSTVHDVYGDFVEVQTADGQPLTDANAASYVTISGDTFTDSGRQGVAITNGNHITIDHVTFTGTGADAVDIEPDVSTEDGYAVAVTNSTFVPPQGAYDLAIGGWCWAGGCHDITFNANSDTAIRPTCASSMVFMPGGPGGVRIANVTASGNTGYSLTDGFFLIDGTNVNVTGNTLHGYGQGCGTNDGIAGFGSINGGSVTNNTGVNWSGYPGGAYSDLGGNTNITVSGNAIS